MDDVIKDTRMECECDHCGHDAVYEVNHNDYYCELCFMLYHDEDYDISYV